MCFVRSYTARLVIAHPENLRRGEAGQGGIRDHLDEPLAPAGFSFDLGALLCGALIVPQHGRAERFFAVGEKNAAMHLAG